jgi:hypothetical protein
MRTIEIYINTRLADFKDLESLPLSWTKTTDKFLEIVGASGSDVQQAFRSMSFPATQNNSVIFEAQQTQATRARGDTVMAMQIFADGIQVFTGQVSLKNTVRRDGFVHSYVVEAVGDGTGVWEKLDTLTLNDLDLGSQFWTSVEIFSSWSKTVDDMRGIFAPVIYGASVSTQSILSFTPEDFRFSVYYKAIFIAIFKKIGYTITSDFFAATIFRESVYLYGNGEKMIRGDNYKTFGGDVNASASVEYGTGLDFFVQFDTKTTDLLNQFDIDSFTPQNNGEYKSEVTIEVNIAVEVTFAVFSIAGVPKRSTAYEIGTDRVKVEHTEELFVGEKMFIFCRVIDPQNVSGPSRVDFARWVLNCTTKPFVGATINVASCLHDKPVKDFLRGVTHQFCGAWLVNETIKTVTFEPRFDYTEEIDGTKTIYKGFYGNAADPKLTIESDIGAVEIDYNLPFGDKLTLGYAEDGNEPLEFYYKKGGKLPAYSAFIEFNKRGGKESINRNPFFTTLYISKPIIYKIAHGALPTILPSGYKIGEFLPGTISQEGTPPVRKVNGKVTFESNPKCGLIIRNGANVFVRDENNVGGFVNVPFVTQQFARIIPTATIPIYNFCLSYSDVVRPTDNTKTKGLARNLYQKYFTIIRQGIQVKLIGKIRLVDLAQFNFRKMVLTQFDRNPSLWIPLSIDGFKIANDQKATIRMMKNAEPTVNDAEKTTFFDPKIDIFQPDVVKKS